MVLTELKGFRLEQGLVWPDYDKRCAEVTFKELHILPSIMRYVKQRCVVVQAGGNCGQFVLKLAEEFSYVYTFEPDTDNFTALTVNTFNSKNVIKFQSAIGNSQELRGMIGGDSKFPKTNCGALYMSGEGQIPTIPLDILNLKDCDLLMLDVEGGEYSALCSGEKTIEKCRPVIVIEDKGLGSKFYGESPLASEKWLKAHGYRLIQQIKNDKVFVY